MMNQTRWGTFVLGVLILTITVTAQPVLAGPIGPSVSAIDGGYESVGPGPLPTLFILFDGTVGSTTELSPLINGVVTPLRVDVTGAADPIPTVTLVEAGTMSSIVVIMTSVGIAVFTISNPAALTILDEQAGIGTITAPVTLDGGQTTILPSDADLSPYNLGGVLTLGYSGITITSGMVTNISPDAASNLSIQAVGGVVPEPASLTLAAWGLIGMAGVWYTRRRR